MKIFMLSWEEDADRTETTTITKNEFYTTIELAWERNKQLKAKWHYPELTEVEVRDHLPGDKK
jgi:hypothetical protein